MSIAAFLKWCAARVSLVQLIKPDMPNQRKGQRLKQKKKGQRLKKKKKRSKTKRKKNAQGLKKKGQRLKNKKKKIRSRTKNINTETDGVPISAYCFNFSLPMHSTPVRFSIGLGYATSSKRL